MLRAHGSELMPVPHGPDVSRAEAKVREVYGQDLSSSIGTARRTLARRLLKSAGETQDDTAARYVLLCEARDVAVSAGDAPTALKAIDRLAGQYQINILPMVLSALSSAERTSRDAKSFVAISRAAIREIDRAVLLEDHDAARKLVGVADSCAAKAREAALRQLAQARLRDVNALAEAFAHTEEARKVLATNPADAPSNLSVGQYLCLTKGDWAAGLTMLTKGNEGPLRTLSESESKVDASPTGTFDVAGAWWDHAEGLPWLHRRHARQRAAEWYGKALVNLSGINRSLAESRIRTVELEALRDQNIEPGLVAELFEGTDFSTRLKTRIDPAIDFDWDENAPDPALKKDDFAFRWTGLLQTKTPGPYAFTVIANLGARVWIDDRLVIDRPNLTRITKGATEQVKLDPGLHAIRVEYWDTSGTANVRLLWTPPGATKPEPIPPAVLWHDLTDLPF